MVAKFSELSLNLTQVQALHANQILQNIRADRTELLKRTFIYGFGFFLQSVDFDGQECVPESDYLGCRSLIHQGDLQPSLKTGIDLRANRGIQSAPRKS